MAMPWSLPVLALSNQRMNSSELLGRLMVMRLEKMSATRLAAAFPSNAVPEPPRASWGVLNVDAAIVVQVAVLAGSGLVIALAEMR